MADETGEPGAFKAVEMMSACFVCGVLLTPDLIHECVRQLPIRVLAGMVFFATSNAMNALQCLVC